MYGQSNVNYGYIFGLNHRKKYCNVMLIFFNTCKKMGKPKVLNDLLLLNETNVCIELHFIKSCLRIENKWSE